MAESLVVQPRLGEFSAECIPLEEILAFYHLEGVTVPELRPYTWSMTVGSLDSVISFQEADARGCVEASMGHVACSGSGADRRLLQGGWMFADAIVGTAQILREEPHAEWILCDPTSDDLQQWRDGDASKRKHPINVILTHAERPVNLNHPIFAREDVCCLIATTESGAARLRKQDAFKQWQQQNNDILVCMADEKGNVSYDDMLRQLRTTYQVRFMEVTAGGRTIDAFVRAGLLDEYRLTIAGQLIGQWNAVGHARSRTLDHACEDAENAWQPHNNPHIDYVGMRAYGRHHLFVRGVVKYRRGLMKAPEEPRDECADRQ